jgi:hypothetical protein
LAQAHWPFTFLAGAPGFNAQILRDTLRFLWKMSFIMT